MTLVNSFDLLVAQMEKAIQINGRLRREAQKAGDLTKYNRLIIFGRRLNSLHAKMTVARAEVTNLCIYGCDAVTSPLDAED